jgi:hypothetical protein
MRVKVELLENHGAITAHQERTAMVRKQFPVQDDIPIGRLFQAVDAPDKGTLSRPRRPDNRNLFPLPDMKADILQYFQIPKGFTNFLHPYHHTPHAAKGQPQNMHKYTQTYGKMKIYAMGD